MTKIRNIVQINAGYTSYVDLYEDYYDILKNRGRMERYKPIAAHRLVFEKLANALNPKDRRFYFLSGSYGTGKSHLLLMMANYFTSPSDVPEIEVFFNNYEIAQSEVKLRPGESLNERAAISLKAARNSGRFLVALCRYSLNLDFEGALLRALQEALNKDEADLSFDSHYNEALRRIKEWESQRATTRFYAELENALNNLASSWTMNDIIEGLQKYDEQSLATFKECFKLVTSVDFTYNKDNLRDIISDFLINPQFKKIYKGIVFLYDEFGAAIDAGLVNYTTLLDFAQYCANSTLEKGGAVVFIGTGHKAFRNHGKVGDLNAETLEARVSEIGLQTQGMEDIISSIVQPLKDKSEWIQQVQPHSPIFTLFSGECNRLRLFNWLPAPKIKYNIIENIYPMHPLATYALLRLANEAGSDNRSVFKFFAPEFDDGAQGWKNVQPYSYPWFIENQEIIKNDKLDLYTTDYLVDYFVESLKATNNRLEDRVKTAVINYEATIRELNAYLARESQQQLFEEADELMIKIIKVMLVNEIASKQEAPITNTRENIFFALAMIAPDEKIQVENRLRLLSDAGIIFNNNGVYELISGNRKDVQRLVDQYKSNPDNRPANLMQSFLETQPLTTKELYMEAKDYNAQFDEDKRLKVVFATPAMLSETQTINGIHLSYFGKLEQDRLRLPNGSQKFEGTAVFVFCETEQDIDEAKKLSIKNDQQRVVISIPRNPISIFDAVLTLKSIHSDWYRSQAQEFGPHEKAQEKTIRDDAENELKEAKKAYFNNAKMLWLGISGMEIPVQSDKNYDVANRLMNTLYGKVRNSFSQPEFNKCHINITGSTKGYLKEAGDILCDLSQPIRVNWAWDNNRGSTRYIRKCFVDHQVLRIISTEGDIRYLEPEKDVNKFSYRFPAYAKLINELAALEGKGEANVIQFFKPYFEEYGQGELALTLLLLVAKRFYGDSLRFKREPNNLTDLQINSAEDMLNLVRGQYSSAVIIFEPVSEHELSYFGIVSQLFSNQPAPAGKIYTINEAYKTATSWWDNLPIIARSLNFYEGEERILAEAFSQAKTKDPFWFIKHDLLNLLDQTPGEVLTPAKLTHIKVYLNNFKGTAEAVQSKIEEKILIKVAELFALQTYLDVDLQDAFKQWHNGLSSIQKDIHGLYHNNDSKPLVKHTAYTQIRELLFKTLPDAYGFGSVQGWMIDQVEFFVERIRCGKNHIETNAPQISQLNVEFPNSIEQQGNRVTYLGELTLQAETEDGKGKIFYTKDGSDPSTSKYRQELRLGDSLTIKGNRKVKLVVADEQGNYSAVQTFDTVDELVKYKIVRPVQRSVVEESISFIFPPNQDAAKITLSSLLYELAQSGIYADGEMQKVIEQLLREI